MVRHARPVVGEGLGKAGGDRLELSLRLGRLGGLVGDGAPEVLALVAELGDGVEQFLLGGGRRRQIGGRHVVFVWMVVGSGVATVGRRKGTAQAEGTPLAAGRASAPPGRIVQAARWRPPFGWLLSSRLNLARMRSTSAVDEPPQVTVGHSNGSTDPDARELTAPDPAVDRHFSHVESPGNRSDGMAR